MLKLDLSNLEGVVSQQEIDALAPELEAAHAKLYDPAAPGADFTGWVRLPENYDKEEFARIQKAAARIRKDSQVLVVVGIGGSYLGARAALEVFPSNGPEICFVGCSLSPNELDNVIRRIDDRDWSINVISKSGGTTEPAVAFRVFRDLLVKQYGKDADKRIYATTDKARGALKTLADSNGWETFVVPDDVGGRFSVLSAVGLLPIAVGGTDIAELMAGARDAMTAYDKRDMFNPVWQYVAARNALYRKGKKIELFCNYEPSYSFVGEWLKQLFGESEGKDQKGIFPASVAFSTDLHSMGQFIQDGNRNLFETVVDIQTPAEDFFLEEDPENLDGLNFLSGQEMSKVNRRALEGTILAHTQGGVPNMVLELPDTSEYEYGYMVYFFEKACAVSGYLSGVNPFDQPGVEAYKKNMFALLGKPGYEDLRGELLEKLK